jgi:predicted membrane protein DUF2142
MSAAAVRRRAYACVALVAAGVLALLALTLTHAAQRRSGSNGVRAAKEIDIAGAGDRFCQARELIPADTAALRVSLSGDVPLLVTLTRRGRLLDRVRVPFGWTGAGFVVPIRRTTRDLPDVEVCFQPGHGAPVTLRGSPAPSLIGQVSINGRPTGQSLRIDALRPGRESWATFLPTIAHRIGRARGSGPWIAWAILALVLCSWAVAGWVLRRAVVGDGGSLRATAGAIALVAVLNAAAWSLITPPFQVPDETVHVAYAQEIGEAARPPVRRGPQLAAFSPELRTAMLATRAETGGFVIEGAGVWTPTEARVLKRLLSRPLPTRGNGDAGESDPEPPLYYALAAVPYRLLHGGTLLTRMAGMRLLSALLAGVTAAFAFLFVRECLPERPWTWSVGGLVAAFVPMFGFVSGGVHPDALLFAVSAALLYCLARASRRGMTWRHARWIGAVIAVGVLSKLNFYSLLPGALVATVLLARRSERRWSGRVAGCAAAAAGPAVVAFLVLKGLDTGVWGRPWLPEHRPFIPPYRGSLLYSASFVWGLFLPPLPGMTHVFPTDVGYEAWFRTFVGDFGSVTIPLPTWAYHLALAIFALLLVLAGRALVAARAALRRRWGEALGYVLMIGGLLGLIAYTLKHGWVPGMFAAAQGRYLLPFLALFAAFVALAARGAGERWGRPVGATLVIVAIGWSLLGQLVAIAGFYS